MNLHDFLMVLPEEILSAGGLVLMLIAAWGGDKAGPVLTWLAVLLLAVAGMFVPGVREGSGGTAFGGLFAADSFAAFAKLVIYGGAAVAMLMAMSWFGRDRDYRAEYPVLIIFSAVGMGMMVSATDLLTLYVGLELTSLASYVLASFQRTDTRSAEAGLKYFVLGALASGILLYGISLLYGFTGTTSFPAIAATLGHGVSTGQLFGLAASGVAGVASVLTYMAVYLVMTLGTFLVILRMRDAEGRPVETIASLSGLSQTRPMLAAAMAMFMFSLAGIPGLFGFWPK